MENDRSIRWLLDAMADGAYCMDLDRRITHWNPAAVRITGYTAEEVLGRSCSDSILRHVNAHGVNLCVGGCPLTRAISQGEAHEEEMYLHHKDGHRLPVTVRCSPLRDAEGTIVGGLELFSDATHLEALRQRVAELEELAFLDSLTSVANRRYVEFTLRQTLEEWKRYNWPFGIILYDVDFFKAVNDTHGHDIGDRALRMVAQTLAQNLRAFDLVGRWGGEEFIVMVKNVGTELLMTLADRLRMLVGASFFDTDDGATVTVTVSGGATVAQRTDSVASLLHRADQFLYTSKHAGRNQITTDTHDVPRAAPA